MFVLDVADGDVAQPPGTCFICLGHFTEGRRLVDTETAWWPEDNTPAIGRTARHGAIYVCEQCASALCYALTGHQLADLTSELDALTKALGQREKQLAKVNREEESIAATITRIAETRTRKKPGPPPGTGAKPKAAQQA